MRPAFAALAAVIAALNFAVMISSGDAQEPSLDVADITGVVWHWHATLFNDGMVIFPTGPARYTLELRPDGRAAVRADCNQGGGAYTLDGDRIEIGPIATTLIACPPGSLGSEFTQQLDEAARFFTQDGDMFLALSSDRGFMRFTRAPVPAPSTPVASATPPATVTGVVTYRERIALPPDAIVTVRIEDTSRADAPAILVGEQAIRDAGQVPIPFAVPYDPALIDPRNRYTLRARIESADGRLLWTNTQAYPVITGGNPTSDVEVVVMRVG
jgi:uncharacterized lipoprotein YbaY